MWAGTVDEPPGFTSPAIVSVTSRSRSVALNARRDWSALMSTLARIGIVLRFSTTRWTWPSDLRRSARSTVTFMGDPVHSGRPPGAQKVTLLRPTANRASVLQLSLQKFDLFRQGGVAVHQIFDLAHGMQDGRVVSSPKTPSYFGERTQCQGFGKIHRDLAGTNDIRGPP